MQPRTYGGSLWYLWLQASGAVGLLIYDQDSAAEQLFTLADDGNGSAVRIPVLLLPQSRGLNQGAQSVLTTCHVKILV